MTRCFKRHFGFTINGGTANRWFYEKEHQIRYFGPGWACFEAFATELPTLRTAGGNVVAPATVAKITAIMSDDLKKRKLKMEVAILMDIGEVLIKACYER